MLLILVLTIVCLIVVFPNVLIYTISLLIVSVSLLLLIVSINYIRTLIFLLIVIVYVGAIIILIGYICAVCPNFTLINSSVYYTIPVTLIFFNFFMSSFTFNQHSPKSGTLLDYFFSLWGSPIFLLISFILFLTLIIVTSQYSSPQGPLRSV